MNRFLTFLLAILITGFASGQNKKNSTPVQSIFPSFNDHPEWNVQRSIEPSMPGPVYVMSYHLEKDTIINQKSYSPVSRTGNQQPLLAYEHVGFVRTDGKKVFFKKSAEGKEYLLYDFGLKVGEKVYCPFYETDSAKYEVLAVDSVVLNGIKRLRLKVLPEYYPEKYASMYWIEGIGSLWNPFYQDGFLAGGISDEVRCVSADSGQLYANPNYDDCTTVLKKTDCIVNEGFVWSGMEIYKDLAGKDSVASYHIKFEGDTLLNDRTYTKIWQSNDSLGINWDLTGLIREVENRVYYHKLYDDSWNDLLLYDFSAQTGKSMLLSSVGSPGLFGNMKVTSVDSVEINGAKRLRIQLSDGTDNDTWIEKIGSLQGIINHCYFEPVKIERSLLCVSENGNTIYTNEEYPECFYLNETIQSGFNLVNSGYVWHDLITTSEDENCCLYTHSIKFSGDTVLNSMTYKKVLQSNDSTQTHWQTIGFVRESSKTGLYFKSLNETQEETLLYNYNLELNDTVRIPNIFGDRDSSFFIVSSIENVLIGGNTKKKYLLIYPEYQNFTETWIEGIGSLSGVLREGYFCLCNTNTLLCCSHNNELIYKNPDFENCYYSKTKVVGVKAIQSGQFKIIHDFSNQQVILKFPEKKQRKISVFNIAGAIVETFETFETDEILNISGYKPGLYFISSTGELSKNQKLIKY